MITGPGRGSAAGSLVAYSLDITQIDPIKYGLLFSRFLRTDAKDYPDIDFDVSDAMGIKDILIERWGDNVVAPISNWNTLQLKSLIKDISKFYEIPFIEVNAVTGKMLAEATPSNIRMMPNTMINLIGTTDGFHIENSRWLVSME